MLISSIVIHLYFKCFVFLKIEAINSKQKAVFQGKSSLLLYELFASVNNYLGFGISVKHRWPRDRTKAEWIAVSLRLSMLEDKDFFFSFSLHTE